MRNVAVAGADRPEARRRSTASLSGLEQIAHPSGRLVWLLEWSGRRVGAVGRATVAPPGTATTRRVTSSRWRPHRGRRRYEVGDGRVVSVTDADGVELVRNGYDPDGRVAGSDRPSAAARRTGTRARRHGRRRRRGRAVGHPSARPGRPAGGRGRRHGARMTKRYDGWGNPVATSDRTGAVVSSAGTSAADCCGGRSLTVRARRSSGTSRTASSAAPILRGGGATVVPGDDREPSRGVDRGGHSVGVVGGQVAAMTDPDGVITRFERNGDGLMTAVVDGLGARTMFRYDDGRARGRGRRRRGRDPVRPGRRGSCPPPDRSGRHSVGFEWTAAGRLPRR